MPLAILIGIVIVIGVVIVLRSGTGHGATAVRQQDGSLSVVGDGTPGLCSFVSD